MQIIVLHGMGRTPSSMRHLTKRLSKRHTVHNLSYGFRTSLIDSAHALAETLKGSGLEQGGPDIGFVCHSAGGVVLRAFAREYPEYTCGNCVALGSPLSGSVLATTHGFTPLLKLIYGPLFSELSKKSVEKLPLPPGPLGSIAGNKIFAPHPSHWLLQKLAPGQPSDSTVLVEETRMRGMADHTIVDCAHPFLINSKAVHDLIEHFLKYGRFGKA